VYARLSAPSQDCSTRLRPPGRDSILVNAGSFTGSRSSPTSLGVSPTGNWAEPGQGVKISWNITELNGVFTYKYMLSTLTGVVVGAVSHFILETSEAFTRNDVLTGSNSVNRAAVVDAGDAEQPEHAWGD
jgi:hypothetical protein